MGPEIFLSTDLAVQVGVQLLGEGTVLLAVACLATLVLRRGTPGQRHAVWSAAFALALLLPAVGAILPARQIPLSGYRAGLGATPPDPGPATAGAGWNGVRALGSDDPGSAGPVPGSRAATDARSAPAGLPLPDGETIAFAFLFLWATGSLALAVRLAGHWVRIASVTAAGRRLEEDGEVAALVRREAAAAGVRRRVHVVFTDRLEVPATGGLVRPILILPEGADEWPEARLRAVVLHELMHVRRWDLLAHQLAEVARIIYWINPLLWLAHRAAAEERERACDRAVVRRGIPGPEYAGVLVEMARRCRTPSPTLEGSLAMARPGRVLRRRVEAVLDGSVRRAVRGRTAALAGLLLLLGSLPLASVEVLAVPAGSTARLEAALASSSVDVRLHAVRDLAAWCPGESTRALGRTLLDDDDPRVRQAAATALALHGRPGSLRSLRSAAADADNPLGVRAAAVEAMGAIRHPATVAALRAFLESPEPSLRWLALKNLGVATTIPGPELISELERALRTDPEPRNRVMAATVLDRLGCEDATETLDRARLHDPSDLVRRRAAELLGLAEDGGPADGLVGSPPTL
ncbi:MAG: M56 family metallopeptidase [Gemmatimonadota bacterium]|jgi:beta-lactamase regulating signal transducer with metallopeptidase domain